MFQDQEDVSQKMEDLAGNTPRVITHTLIAPTLELNTVLGNDQCR